MAGTPAPNYMPPTYADDDAALTVRQLSEAKVTKAGIVCFEPATTKGEE